MKCSFLLLLAIAAATANLCRQKIDIERLLPHEDCNKFYKCTYGQPAEQDCPSGLHFSLELGICDWPANVDCGYRNVLEDREEQGQEVEEIEPVQFPEEAAPEVEAEDCTLEEDYVEPEEEIALHENGCPVNPHVHKLMPHEDNCSLFYICVRGEKELNKCAASLHFNSELQVCDWPSNAGCALSANKDLFERGMFRQ